METHEPNAAPVEPMSEVYGHAVPDGGANDPAASDPSPPDAQPRRLPRRRLIALASLLALATVTGVAFGPTSWRVLQQSGATIDTPQRVAGLTRDDSDDARQTADYFRTAVWARVSMAKTVGAVYLGGADRAHSVVFGGGTGLLLSPEKALDSLFPLADDENGSVTNIRSEPVQALGGYLKCGSTTSGGTIMSVCGWADYGSVALAFFLGRDIDESAHLFQQMRTEMLRR